MPQKRKELLVEFESTGIESIPELISVSPAMFDYLGVGYKIWECES